MIQRKEELGRLKALLRRYPVVGIIGARQVGKTTLARMLVRSLESPSHVFDLEDPEDLARLEDPLLSLQALRGVVVIDEIQRRPELFPVLRMLADRAGRRTRYVVLGSASPGLLRQSSESLAGRIAYHELSGFGFDEVRHADRERLWLRGGFPPSFLAGSDDASHDWRRRFIRTFLERDLPELGITIRSATLRRFWAMLAHYHGQTWNASEFGRSFGVADTTVRHYLDVLTSALVVRQLPPWHENLSKRQVKAPKVYIRDSGMLHALIDVTTRRHLERHPKVGASWEGFMVEQLIRTLTVEPEHCFYWATYAGAELDLLVFQGGRRIGFEIKRTTRPHVTPSMRSALSDLKLERIDVIHAGESTFDLQKHVRAVSWKRLSRDLA
ncbi:MAG: ATP-binding protein [Candidatus Omnitrophica bacterium]|nr:ATP-binding protein [Candidatus Omnitrophota bacterium]